MCSFYLLSDINEVKCVNFLLCLMDKAPEEGHVFTFPTYTAEFTKAIYFAQKLLHKKINKKKSKHNDVKDFTTHSKSQMLHMKQAMWSLFLLSNHTWMILDSFKNVLIALNNFCLD